jgi:hypothetical protein
MSTCLKSETFRLNKLEDLMQLNNTFMCNRNMDALKTMFRSVIRLVGGMEENRPV